IIQATKHAIAAIRCSRDQPLRLSDKFSPCALLKYVGPSTNRNSPIRESSAIKRHSVPKLSRGSKSLSSSPDVLSKAEPRIKPRKGTQSRRFKYVKSCALGSPRSDMAEASTFFRPVNCTFEKQITALRHRIAASTSSAT